jgi:gas vesicle protein
MATSKDELDRRRREQMMELLKKGEDPAFVRYAMWREYGDTAAIDKDLQTIQELTGGQPTTPKKVEGITVNGETFTPTTYAEASKYQEEQKKKETEKYQASTVLNEKLKNFEDLLSDTEGLKASAGTNIAGRSLDLPLNIYTDPDRSRFAGGAAQALSKESLQSLIDAKAAGATFGALSDQELKMLQQSASKLGQWAIIKDGKITGFNASEEDVQKELKNLKEQTKLALSKVEEKPEQPTQIQDPQIEQARQWLQENPNDPRAEKVRAKLGLASTPQETAPTTQETTPMQGKITGSQAVTEVKEDQTDTKPMYQKVGETLGDFFGGKQIGEAVGNYVGTIIAKQSGKKDKENTISTIEKAYQEGTITKEKRDQALDQYEKEQREVYGYTGPGVKQLLADTAYIATNFIPYGKLAKGASFGAKSLVALRNVATAATSVGLKSVSEGESFVEGAKKGATGYAVVTAVTKPIAPLARFVGGVAKRVGSSFSGIGSEVLDEIIKNPKLAKEGMKMEATDAILKNAKESVSILADYEQRMRTEYADAMKALPQVKVDTPIVKTSILDKISSLLKDRKVNIGSEGLDFSKSRFADPGDEKRISAIFNEIQEIADATPQALNVTKQRIREFRKTSSPDNKIFNNFVDTAVGIVDKQINEFGPEIANINKKFSGKADIADAMRKELGSLESAKNISRADLIKVQKRISTLFTKGKEPVRELFRDLGAEDVIARQAGTEIGRVNEGQSSKISDAIMNVVRASGIPKAVGGSALAYGQVKSVVDKVISGREKELSDVERRVLSKILATFGETE